MYFEEFSLSDDFESSLQTLIDILLLSQEVYPKKKKERNPCENCHFQFPVLIHMKLMLFTDFLQTHQSNLRPSDRFPPLNFTKLFGGDANASNNRRVKTWLGDLSETKIIKNL